MTTPLLSLRKLSAALVLAAALVPATARSAHGADDLCDTSFQNCRTRLINLIRNESVGIDVAFWFMTDRRYVVELVKKWKEGVPVRVIVDPRANPTYPDNVETLAELQAGGVPMRRKSGGGILHWKMMLFAGQGTVQFSGANYSDQAFVPRTAYSNYVDEVIYFTDDQSVVNSFKTKYDDLWTRTSGYSNYANVSGTLTRRYPTFSKDPELNFPPAESFRSRSLARYNAETVQIDAIMFRITDAAHTDALIAALARGVRVRLITDYGQYTWTERYWHSWNVDRLLEAGAEVRVAGERVDRQALSQVGHLGTVHQKSTILHGQGMTIFGSSNWTSPSTDSQEEHNYFTTKGTFFTFFRNQFERKWNNSNPVGAVETVPLQPLPPDPQTNVSPANNATGQSTSSVTLRWRSGLWTHVYDVYVGTTSDPPLLAANLALGPAESSSETKSLTLTSLQPGTTYYWRVVGKTMADVPRSGPIWSFTTSGSPPSEPPPPPPPPSGSLPSGWSTQDIGNVGAAGAAAANGGTFAVHGSGADIWDNADAFRFAYRTLSGDGTIVARVASLQNTDPWAKAGVMIRETLSAGSRHASMFVTPGKGTAFQRRTSSNGSSTHTAGPSQSAPYWVRIERSGNTFTAYSSSNGSSWTLVGSQTISMSSSVYVGLAVTSHNARVVAAATFDNVSLSSGTTTPPPPSGGSLPDGWSSQDVGSVGVAGGSSASSSSAFTVTGAGADIWGSSDAFQFAHRSMTGDGSIVARVTAVQNVDPWTKAGVMIRESSSAGSKHASMFVTPGKGLAFQRRTSTGGSSTHTAGANQTAPHWVRIDRIGNTFSAYTSPNGSSWTLVGTETIVMNATVRVGLAVTSHRTGVAATASFTNVAIGGASGTPSGALPSGWTSGDVGAVARAGSAVFSGGTFTVEGSGADIWNTADEFRFVHRSFTGDGEFVARIGSLSGSHHWAKAGVMVRAGTAASSAHASMFVSRERGLAFQRRTATGVESIHTDGGSGTAPVWVRLVRSGDLFLAYRSSNGSTWTFVDSATIPMGATVRVGLAVTSHDDGTLARATFDNVSFE